LRRGIFVILTLADLEPTARLDLIGQGLTGQCVPVLLDIEEIL